MKNDCYACQWLDNADMHTYSKFDQTIPCGSRGMKFVLTGNGRIDGQPRPTENCLAKHCHRFVYLWLDNVKINTHAKFDPNIPCGSRSTL